MITPITEYYTNLSRIQSNNKKTLTILLPSSEPVLEIDLESRTIEAPNFISIAEDHRAETVFFSVNRYFGTTDLSNLAIVIQYINAKGESRLYPVEYLDVTTLRYEQKMLFPWMIGEELTSEAGLVNFSVCFYDINTRTNEFNYCLNTLPTSTYILEGFGQTASSDTGDMTTPPGYSDTVKDGKATLEALAARIAKMEEDTTIYWEYAAGVPAEMLPEDPPSNEEEETPDSDIKEEEAPSSEEENPEGGNSGSNDEDNTSGSGSDNEEKQEEEISGSENEGNPGGSGSENNNEDGTSGTENEGDTSDGKEKEEETSESDKGNNNTNQETNSGTESDIGSNGPVSEDNNNFGQETEDNNPSIFEEENNQEASNDNSSQETDNSIDENQTDTSEI